MDTWLYRGDHKRNEQGFVEKISGGMEKIQAVQSSAYPNHKGEKNSALYERRGFWGAN